MTPTDDQLVLVTGGSGFVGCWCIIKLLEQGYRVRTTIRSQKREKDVLDMLQTGGATRINDVSFATADLSSDAGWKDAISGCTYVLHVASPFPSAPPKHEDDLIIPAREGTLRVLRMSRDAGVKRVVITSSFAAIGYGHPASDHVFNEEDWTDPTKRDVRAYQKSKAIAERAAWDFMKKEGGSMELVVINPVGIYGPLLGPDFATSIYLIKRLLDGDVPGCPQLYFGVVDVRDVADIHLLAMKNPKAAGQRFLAVADGMTSVLGMSKILHERLPADSKKAPTWEVPNFVVRLVGLWDKQVTLITHELGKKKRTSNEKAKTVLGWKPRPMEDAIQTTAESLIKFGLVKKA